LLKETTEAFDGV